MKVALDIPSYWEEHIRTAKFDVTIISPYITDSRAVKAFLNKAQEQSCQCQLVTHRDAIQHISSRPQLEQMKRALEMGSSVSMVSKLHAKALIVDGKLLSIGSQNFTKNGEQNVELSVEVDLAWMPTNEDVSKLYKAVEEAKNLDLLTIQHWLELNVQYQLELEALNEKWKERIHPEISQEVTSSRQGSQETTSVGWASLRNREKMGKSVIKMTCTQDGDIFKFKRQDEGHLRYVDREKINLCQLSIKQRNGHVKEINLAKSSVVPMRINDAGRYVLCKLNNTLFSQFLDQVQWRGELPYLKSSVAVKLTCLKTQTQKHSFKVSIKDSDGNGISGNVLVANNKLTWVDHSVTVKQKTRDFESVVARINENSEHWLGEVFEFVLCKPLTQYEDKRYVDVETVFDTKKLYYYLKAELLGRHVGLSLLP
ncbi:phospholipase D family protein [Vibrio parahaemolyticus]|nr:hypothetical protein [Vibrio parahaemolyticus]HCE1808712.1 phospholipase D family protein [Vibrio parahaemolyticus]HCG7676329.1 phospholipase D family protein [Vibrio parahaemolyticus]